MSALALRTDAIRDRLRATSVCGQRQLLEYQIERLVAAGLLNYQQAGPLRRLVPIAGLFLIVPPQPDPLDLDVAMALIDFQGVRGRSYVISEQHRDLDRTASTKLALLSDIEDGSELLRVSPGDARSLIHHQRRHAFRTWHGIIYAMLFPWTMFEHGLYVLASRHCDRCVLTLAPDGLTSGRRPIVLVRQGTEGDAVIGAPSFGAANVL